MLEVSGLSTEYRDERGRRVRGAEEVAFEVPEGKLFTLLGPSGCGKTTTLRSIAGLERPVAGEIRAAGRVVSSAERGIFVAPNRRGFGMVFQSYAIWPHLTVFENAAFPLRVGLRRLPAAELRERVMRVLATVGLAEFAERPAPKLSGGQQQRLALARALVMEPVLLLLDEPLSNLDQKLRERMRLELKRLQRELGLTAVYVTHDQGEALALSHRIAVMRDGRIVQTGTPREIYERPADRFVADFVGTTNLVEGRALGPAVSAGLCLVETPLGRLEAAAPSAPGAGASVLLSIRPEDLAVVERALPGPNRFEGRLAERVFLGEALELEIRVGGQRLLARAHPSLEAAPGEPLHLAVDPSKCLVLANPA